MADAVLSDGVWYVRNALDAVEWNVVDVNDGSGWTVVDSDSFLQSVATSASKVMTFKNAGIASSANNDLQLPKGNPNKFVRWYKNLTDNDGNNITTNDHFDMLTEITVYAPSNKEKLACSIGYAVNPSLADPGDALYMGAFHKYTSDSANPALGAMTSQNSTHTSNANSHAVKVHNSLLARRQGVIGYEVISSADAHVGNSSRTQNTTLAADTQLKLYVAFGIHGTSVTFADGKDIQCVMRYKIIKWNDSGLP